MPKAKNEFNNFYPLPNSFFRYIPPFFIGANPPPPNK